MNIVFLGFISSDERLRVAFERERAPQVSAVKFQKALLQGLGDECDRVRIISTLPIAAYPRSPLLWIRGGEFTLDRAISGREISVLNLPVAKLPLRFLGACNQLRKLCRRGDVDAIVVYGAHTPFVASAELMRRWYGVDFAVFVPDLPLHMRGKREAGIRAWLKRLDNVILQRLVAKACVAFPFARAIGEEWLPPEVPYEVVEGVAPAVTQSCCAMPGPSGRRTFVYTGAFSQISRFASLFHQRKEIEAELVFIGAGPEEAELRALAERDDRVIVKSFMTEERLAGEIEAADILLNPRDTQWEGARYSFPSKLMDYLSRGLPVASTRLAGIPAEYFEVFFALDDSSAEALAASLNDVISADAAECQRRIDLGYRLLQERKSPSAVARRVLTAVRNASPKDRHASQ